jgi:hypothetical protein
MTTTRNALADDAQLIGEWQALNDKYPPADRVPDGNESRVCVPYRGHTHTNVHTFGGIEVESWGAFMERAAESPAELIEGLIGAGGIGFLGAAPKYGKTWLAILMAISVASGKQFLGRFTVPTARPVLYLAMEGTREALRTRFDVIARGMGVDLTAVPIHIAYKPRGLDLSNPEWASALVDAADALDVGLVVVDVMRRATTVRESGDGATDFAALLKNLQGLDLAGRSLMILHHFVKSSEATKGRRPGELMAGSGSLEGSMDYALFVTRSAVSDDAGVTSHTMTVEHQARDIRSVKPFAVGLEGAASGGYGTWEVGDTVTATVDDSAPISEADVMRDQLIELLQANPKITQGEAASALGTTRHTAVFTKAWAKVSRPAASGGDR